MHLGLGAIALPVATRFAQAQAYPTRPVRILVGLPPGGQIDIVARLIGQWLSDRLGQSFIIENRPGAGGNIATEAVVRAPADGYTLLMCTTANAVNATLYQNLNYNFVRDIAPVGATNRIASLLEVHPSFPERTVAELIAYAKANPGKVNIATPPIGTGPHMAAELFKMMTGVDVLIVPYRGDSPMLADLLGGQVQVAFGGISASIAHVRAGKLVALAVTTAARSEALPDIPPISDAVPGFATGGWQGIGAPSGTSAEIIGRLNKTINEALADSQLTAKLEDLGVEPMPMTPAEFGKLIADETEKWAKVVKFANIRAE
jgi:tripartite-type tricarboxylate transporter receptor subunit TctC